MKLNPIMAASAMSLVLSSSVTAQTVSGIVKNSQGTPVNNAKVAIVNTKQHVFTNQKGEFLFSDLSQGSIELHVTKKMLSHKNQKLVIGKNNVTDVEFVLFPSAMEIIDVHATPLHSSNIESALPVNVIASDELRLKQSSTLGETLKNEVGVHSSYYGPVSSSPIIRGLDGPRVLVTQNGLDVGDASRVGPDHVVSSETSTAQQIEVLRGPATLFYGSGAIGGVVNVVDNRVPTTLDQSINYMLKHNDVADENEASVAIDTSSNQFAFHFDGFWRESNNYEIPGFAESEAAHEEHEEHEEEHDEHEDEHEEELGEYGFLPNSASKASGFTIGSSYILDNGFVGFSFGRMNREYGVPGHSHGDEHHEEEDHQEHDDHDEHEEESVFADLEQDRIQLLSELTFDKGFINKVASKVSYTDYQHQEIEGGEVGTQFNSEMVEMRFDIFHQDYAGWKGAWTFHYKNTDFEAVGDEAFTPPSKTKSYALAWLEEKHFDDVLVQLGARVERVEIEATGIEVEEHHDDHDLHDDEHHEDEDEHELIRNSQEFTPVSLSAGLVWDYQPGYNIGLSASYSQRAPSAAELYSNGPHIGTNTFEVGALYEVHQEGDEVHFEFGEQSADLETATNLDFTWRKFEGDFGFVISAFVNHIDNYYYQQDTGLVFAGEHDEHDEHEEEHDEHEEGHDEHDDEGLPIFVYQQNDVEMYGIEAEFVYNWNNGLRSTLFGDYIRAKLSDGGNLPRIPPMRLGAQLDYQSDNYAAQLSVSHYFEQDDIAEMETNTDGYTLVDANFNYYLDGIGDDFVVFVKGNNLTNEEARVHASFLKNVAPLPGRGLEIGIRGSF